ncbi:MAG: selenide, water dikinase SelD [Spirochaetaceae bacterium]|jgi:selenide,water dikinase|nr:selenide, water dikinase SelD [Spirochaetaceae bacterium]
MSLLSTCTSGGCGAKIGAGELSALIGALPVKHDPRLVVGFEGREDAAVWALDDGKFLLSTADFFSPMIDDAYLFGKIAAANALSDIYAMGGKPLFALNLVSFPQKLDKAFLAEILRGGAEKLLEADAVLAGGHSIYDHEPKYGLAVTGIAGNVLRNNTAETGDAVILTKPLGVGLIMSATREEKADPEHTKAAAASMERLNRYAAEKIAALGNAVHASTDVTGFGLAVHAAEMAGARHTIALDTASLPLIAGAASYATEAFSTGGGGRNRDYMEGKIALNGVSHEMRELLFDPQTSGGLLVAVRKDAAQALCDAIRRDDPFAAVIGEVRDRGPWTVEAA